MATNKPLLPSSVIGIPPPTMMGSVEPSGVNGTSNGVANRNAAIEIAPAERASTP